MNWPNKPVERRLGSPSSAPPSLSAAVARLWRWAEKTRNTDSRNQSVKRQLIRSNIVDVRADALIYSTNVQLLLTGGVGAALRTTERRPGEAA